MSITLASLFELNIYVRNLTIHVSSSKEKSAFGPKLVRVFFLFSFFFKASRNTWLRRSKLTIRDNNRANVAFPRYRSSLSAA